MTPENYPGKGEWSVKVRGLPKDYKQMSQDVRSRRGQGGTPVPGRRFLTVQRALLSTLPWLLNCSTSVAKQRLAPRRDCPKISRLSENSSLTLFNY